MYTYTVHGIIIISIVMCAGLTDMCWLIINDLLPTNIDLKEYISVDDNTAYGQLACQNTIPDQTNDQQVCGVGVTMKGEVTSATGCSPVIYEELV